MPKAILELEMPESCRTCPIKRYLTSDYLHWTAYICDITGEQIADEGRHPKCPLKLVEGKEVEP